MMNGYFSKIAKQSGIRFFGQDAGGRRSTANEGGSSLRPLHHEEIQIVPPKTSEKRAEVVGPAEFPGSRVDMPRSQQPGQDALAAERSQTVEIAAEIVTERRPGLETTISNHTAETSRFDRFENESSDDVHPDTLSDFQPLEQIILKETARIAGGSDRSDEDLLPRSETITVPESEAAEASNTNEHFAETARAIELGDVSPREVHAILFREVQQWTADQPGSAGPQPIEFETEESASRTPEMPPVRLIGRPKRTESETDESLASNDQQQVSEQNFELSIGTISVVIEDDQRPDRVESLPHRQDPHPAAAEPPRFSRLRRSYI